MKIKISDDVLKKIIGEEIKNALKDIKGGRLYEEKDYKFTVVADMKNKVIETLNKLGEMEWAMEIVDKPTDPSKKKFDPVNKIYKVEVKGGKAGYSFILKWKKPESFSIIPSIPLMDSPESRELYDFINKVIQKGKKITSLLTEIGPVLQGITKFPESDGTEEPKEDISSVTNKVKDEIKTTGMKKAEDAGKEEAPAEGAPAEKTAPEKPASPAEKKEPEQKSQPINKKEETPKGAK